MTLADPCLSIEDALGYGADSAQGLDAHLERCDTCRALVRAVAAERDVVGPALAADDFLVGDRFELGDVLGRGATGTVYRAHDRVLERDVALKRLRGDDQARRAALREARILARLQHRHIVSVFDVSAEGGYLAMELVTGATLRTWCAETTPDRARKLVVFDQIATAVLAAHRAGIVHRDLKPENVFVDASGDVKVGDFGLARAPRAAVAGTSVTATCGSLVGTPAYMAPEQFLGQPVTAAADQFALGVILCELLAGRRPYAGESVSEVRDRVLAGDLDRGVLAALPRRLRRVVRRAVARDPAARFADVEALRGAVARARRSPLRAVAVGAAAVGIAVVALSVAGRGGDAVACPAAELGDGGGTRAALAGAADRALAGELLARQEQIDGIVDTTCAALRARRVSLADARAQTACLRTMQRRLAVTADRLAGGDVAAARALGDGIDASACASAERARAAIVGLGPSADEAAAISDQGWEILTTAPVDELQGRLEALLGRAEALSPRSPQLEAELHLELGRRLSARHGAPAAQHLRRAMAIADEAGLDYMRAHVAVAQLDLAVQQQDGARVEEVADRAGALARRFDWDAPLQARYLDSKATWLEARARYPELAEVTRAYCLIAEHAGRADWQARCRFLGYQQTARLEPDVDLVAALESIVALMDASDIVDPAVVFPVIMELSQRLRVSEAQDRAREVGARAITLAVAGWGAASGQALGARANLVLLTDEPAGRVSALRTLLEESVEAVGDGALVTQEIRAALAGELAIAGEVDGAHDILTRLIEQNTEAAFYSPHLFDEQYAVLAGLEALRGNDAAAGRLLSTLLDSPLVETRVSARLWLSTQAVMTGDASAARALWQQASAEAGGRPHMMSTVATVQAQGLYELGLHDEAIAYIDGQDRDTHDDYTGALLDWYRTAAVFAAGRAGPTDLAAARAASARILADTPLLGEQHAALLAAHERALAE